MAFSLLLTVTMWDFRKRSPIRTIPVIEGINA
jgi:hypothetical protein